MSQGTSIRPFARAILKGGLRPALLFVTLGVLSAIVRAESAMPTALAIHWVADRGAPAVEVSGVPRSILDTFSREKSAEEQAKGLAVFAEASGTLASANRPTMPAMSGKWRVVGDRLRFEPRFPFERGVRYRAEFHAGNEPPVIAFFELPQESAEPTTSVVQIFPSADVLPENQLKFYVQFSAPMSRGSVYEHIRVRDAAGQIIELPFLELDEELWDPTMTRVTLLIDPGRIKRGVKPLEETGPVFEAGKNYALTVDADLRDAADRPLRAAFAKKFRVSAADRTSPDPNRWKIHPPAAGANDSLVVEFDEPMDSALALRLIRVVNASDGWECEGQATIADQERKWSFSPDRAWPAGQYRLTIQTTIEDLAGNNIGKTFDVDVFEGVQRRLTTESVSVKFDVRAW
jgi:hypothetical protein